MSLLKPSDFEDWRRLSVRTIIAIVIASLAWAFFSSFFSQLGKDAAEAVQYDKAPAAAQHAQDNVSRLPTSGDTDKADDVKKASPTDDEAFGGIFNSLGNAKR